MFQLCSISYPLLAVAMPGDGNVHSQVTYELSRLANFDDPRYFWLGISFAVVALLVYVVLFYRREREALAAPLVFLLPMLRLVAFIGAVLFFLGVEKRISQKVITNSEVLLMVDTSQSMSVEDEPNASGNQKGARSQAIQLLLEASSLIDSLRQQHDVVLVGFDRQSKRLNKWRRANNQETDSMQVIELNSEENGETFQEERGDNWADALSPTGVETRIGDALKESLQPDSQQPLAGIVLLSDGGQNLGADPISVLEKNRNQDVPVHVVGVGSTEYRRNVRILDLNVPSRLYPEDHATVKALIQGEDFANRSVDVQLILKSSEQDGAVASSLGSQRVNFESDQQTIPVEFGFEPVEKGRFLLELSINPHVDDSYNKDNIRRVETEVVDAKTKVLLLASGATRDYRFLRDQLRRDKYASVDVLLQNGLPGISQGADKILNVFPREKEELYEYDCIVAFDPDWEMLDAQQADLLESWVAEEFGGLIVVAGPIHTSSWAQNPELIKIRALYPVEFQRRLTLLDDGQYGSKVPWPIDFTDEGKVSSFLWLADSSAESNSLWAQFEGVFGCFAVKGPKPGARVLGRYSDPDAGISMERPVYMAEHFYGSGRVFYLGSGELWRLRSMDPKYFEALYTRLIRHVSQGRLLRGTSRGTLLVERDRYTVGDEVVVRAQLTSENREPLVADSITARVINQDEKSRNFVLTADKLRPGSFIGQFNVRQEGSYSIVVPIPNSIDQQLDKRIQVNVPDLEFEKTRRNEQLLAAIAQRSGGIYYSSLSAAAEGDDALPPVSQKIASRVEERTLRGAPDQEFSEHLNKILLAVICGALCAEWLLRRLVKLA